jgi:hypothetical protein
MVNLIGWFICSLLLLGVASAAAIEQIWMAPANLNYTNAEDYLEPFSAANRGEWFVSDIGIGSRAFAAAVMDSNKTLWIVGGKTSQKYYTDAYGVWNWNPKTDQYRWLWKPVNDSLVYFPGEIGVESDLNSPGSLVSIRTSIDLNDNIWLLNDIGELWMFNTSSWKWVRIQGLSGETDSPSFGANPGQAGADVWPGTYLGMNLIDSLGDLWLVGGSVQGYEIVSNNVWHFNMTSKLWRFVSGDKIPSSSVRSNSTHFAGLVRAGCDIDQNDKIWCFGGNGPVDSVDSFAYSSFSDLWTYDTRTDVWTHKFGSFESLTSQVASENNYDPGNTPSSGEEQLFIDRKDGTFLLVSGFGYAPNDPYPIPGGLQTVWLYNVTLNQWKLLYGNINASYTAGVYVTRREAGSTRPAVGGIASASGTNFNGDVYISGGSFDDTAIQYLKDIWLIPQDQCASSTANRCDVNADCLEEMISYSCQCKQGYLGDGFSCSLPVAPVAANPNTPKSATSDQVRPIASCIWILVTLVLAM